MQSKMQKFTNLKEMRNDIIRQNPDNIIVRNMFSKKLSILKVYVILYNTVDVKIGDDDFGYLDLEVFLSENFISEYAFFDDCDGDNDGIV